MKFRSMLATTAILAFSIPTVAKSENESQKTLCVAHRGDSSEHLENSLEALRSAVSVGAPVVEFDIHHTRDGQAVVMHDAFLRRTARSKKGRHCRKLLPLRLLKLKHILENCELNNGEDIPTLRAVLEELSRSGVGVFLEMKDQPNLETLKLLDEFYRSAPGLLRVISFKKKSLDFTRAHLPEPLALGGTKLFHVSSTERGAKKSYDGVTVRSPSGEFIRRYQSLGIPVGAWTIDSEKSMRRYFEDGADYVTTNHPRLCLAVAEGLGIAQSPRSLP